MDDKVTMAGLERERSARQDAQRELERYKGLLARARLDLMDELRAAGWRLVPVEPTLAMKRACKTADMDHGSWDDWINFEWSDFRRAWDAMPAASPSQPTPTEG